MSTRGACSSLPRVILLRSTAMLMFSLLLYVSETTSFTSTPLRRDLSHCERQLRRVLSGHHLRPLLGNEIVPSEAVTLHGLLQLERRERDEELARLPLDRAKRQCAHILGRHVPCPLLGR